MGRWIVNFLISGMWVLVFNALGWITLSARPHIVADPGLGHLLDAGIIGLIIALAGEVGSFLYVMFVVATLGLGCLLLPLYWLLIGYFKLWLAQAVLQGWFTHTHNLLCVIIMSWILGAGRWHASDEMRRRTVVVEQRDPREVAAQWREVDNDPRPLP